MRNKRYIKIVSSILIILTIFMFSFVLAADDSVYVWSSQSKTITQQTNAKANSNKESSEQNITNEKMDKNATATTNVEAKNSLQLESGGAILIEQHSGQVLYEHNSHEKLRPASVTKVMSILLIMEALDSGQISLTDKVPCTEDAASMGGSQIWLDVREELTVDEMLKAICVVSANDCTVAMADYLCGSQEAFVERMNIRAKELGMNDTTFKNCHGIDEDGHVTSPYDIALMSRELLNNHPNITKYTTIWMDSLREGKSELVNTNKLIRNYKGATGLKTGSTSVALYNLSASATRNDLSLIAVIMKAPTTKVRFAEAQKLLDYGFDNYEYKTLTKKGTILKKAIVTKGVKESTDLILENNVGILIKKGQDKEIQQTINVEENISAPIYEGQKVGEVIFSLDGQEIGRTNIVVSTTIAKKTFSNLLSYTYQKWFSLLRD